MDFIGQLVSLAVCKAPLQCFAKVFLFWATAAELSGVFSASISGAVHGAEMLQALKIAPTLTAQLSYTSLTQVHITQIFVVLFYSLF